MNIAEMTGPEAIEWMTSTFGFSSAARSPRDLDPRGVAPMLRAGITDSEVILALNHDWKAFRDASRGSLTDDDAATFAAIGPTAWYEDPDNREDWATVAEALAKHDVAMEEASKSRRSPEGGSRYRYHHRDVITEIMRAGRGPAYGREIVAIATRNLIEPDAFGFTISAATFRDLAEAGVENRAAVSAYEMCGLTLTDAIAYRADGIPAAAVLMAKRAKVDKHLWRSTLLGLPEQWFTPLGDAHYGTDKRAEDVDRLLRNDSGGFYTIEDLRFLVEHGWTGKQSLSDFSVSGSSAAIPGLARKLAAHGLDFTDWSRWAGALCSGKAPGRYGSKTTTPPLIGWGKGRGSAKLGPANAEDVIALADAGLKPSHMNTYRKAGCRSVQEVLEAHEGGITAKVCETLLREYGTEVDQWHSTRRITSLRALQRAHEDWVEKAARQ